MNRIFKSLAIGVGQLVALAIATTAFAGTPPPSQSDASAALQSILNTRIGDLIASPDQYSLAGRLKAINTTLSSGMGIISWGGVMIDPSQATPVSDLMLRAAYNTADAALAGGGFLIGGTYDTTNPTFGNGKFVPLQTNNRGRVKIVLSGRDSASDISSMTGFADADMAGTLALATGLVAACTDTISGTAAEDTFRSVRLACGSQRMLTQGYETRVNRWSYATGASPLTGTGEVSVKAGVSSIYACVDAVQLGATSLTAATTFVIRNDTAGTILWSLPISTAGLPGGFATAFPSPYCAASGNPISVGLVGAPGGGSVTVNLQGHVTR